MQNILSKISEKHWALIIFIFAFAIYSNTILNDYNLDDNLVTQNHRLTSKGISAIPEIFKSYYYEDEMGYKYGYRPITHVSFAIEHSLFGEKASVSHTINVFLYAITCLLVFFFVRKLKPDISPYFAVLVALLFAVHPIHTEVVASIKNRDEILSLLFGLLALILTISIKDKETFFISLLKWMLILGFFVLSILSKKSTVFFSLIIPLTYLLFKKDKSYIPAIIFSICTSVIVALILELNLNESILFVLLSLIGVIFFATLVKVKKSSLKEIFKLLLNHKFFYLFLLALIIFINLFGWYMSSMLLIYLSISMLLISLIIFPQEKTKLISSTVLMFFLCFIGYKSDKQNMVILSFWAFLILNSKTVKDNKYKFIPLVFILAFISYYINSFKGIPVTEIFIILLYIANIYFKPFFLIFSFSLFLKSEGNLLEIFIAILSIFSLLLFTVKKVKFKYPKIEKLIISLIIILSVFAINNIIDISNSIGSEPIVQVAKSVINDIDRPLLKIENPLIENWNWEHRIPTAFTTTKFYLQKLILPYPLLFYYGYDKVQIVDFKIVDFYISLVIVLLMLVIAFYNFKKRKLLFFGIFFMLTNLVSYSNLMVPVAGIVGERLAYLASLGFSITLGLLVFEFFNYTKFKNLFSISIVLIFFITTSFTIQRNSLWKNKTTLYKNDIKHLGKSAQANALLGYEYLNDNKLDQGLIFLNKAVKIYPDFLNWWFDKAKVEEFLGEVDEAIYSYSKTIRLDSTFSQVPFKKIGFLYSKKNDFSNAIYYLEKALRLNHKSTEIYNALASYYMRNNQTNLAIETLKNGIEHYPQNYDINLNLGKIYYNSEINLALVYFKKAYSINSSDSQLAEIINELNKNK